MTKRFVAEITLVAAAVTNLLLWSERLEQAPWQQFVNVDVDATADTVAAPDGATTAEKLYEATTAVSSHQTTQSVADLADSTTYTFSIFVKAAERSDVRLFFGTKAGTFPSGIFDLAAGTVTGGTATDKRIDDWGGGWFRCSITNSTLTGGSTPGFTVQIATPSSGSYVGTIGSGLYVWGGMLNTGATAAEYVATTSARVTKSTATQYVATSGWTTTPADRPSQTHIPARLKSAGTFQRELFSGRRVAGRSTASFGELVIANDDGAYDAWLGYGVAGGTVTVRWGEESDAYPSGYSTVYVGRVQSLVADFTSLRVRLRDSLELLDRPVVTQSFAGTGGLEGSTAVAGKLKQWVSSDPGYIEPILIDAATQLYFVQSTGSGGVGASFKLYVGGVEITRGADYPDAATCISTAPAAGQCRFWFGPGGDGSVYVRLDAAPAFDVRVYALGYNAASAWSFTGLAAVAGITGGTGSLAIGAQIVDDGSTTYADVMADACTAQFGYFGMTRLGVFTCGVFSTPDVTAMASFGIHNAWNWERQPIQDMDVPVWSVSVSAGTTWPSNVQASATDTLKDYMSRTPVWCSFAGNQSSTLTDNPGADAVSIELRGRHFQNSTQQATFLADYFARFGSRRDFFQCTVQMTDAMLDLELHDTVEIKLPRFSLSAGRNMRIVTQRIDCDRREITFGLWG